jgi:hypothetical protein
VMLSPTMFGSLDKMEGYPGYVVPKQMQSRNTDDDDNSDDPDDISKDAVGFRWLKIQTIDNSFGICRQSSILDIVVVGGFQVIECLLTAVELVGNAHRPAHTAPEWDLMVVRRASSLLLREIERCKRELGSLSSMPSASDKQGGYVQLVLVLESLIGKQGRSGAVHKLEDSVNSLEGAVPCDLHNAGGDATDRVISLRPKPKSRRPRKKSATSQSSSFFAPSSSRSSSFRPPSQQGSGQVSESAVCTAFSLRTAQKLVPNVSWYIYLLFACLTTEHRVQLFQSANDTETKVFVSALMRASNDSSLLLY